MLYIVLCLTGLCLLWLLYTSSFTFAGIISRCTYGARTSWILLLMLMYWLRLAILFLCLLCIELVSYRLCVRCLALVLFISFFIVYYCTILIIIIIIIICDRKAYTTTTISSHQPVPPCSFFLHLFWKKNVGISGKYSNRPDALPATHPPVSMQWRKFIALNTTRSLPGFILASSITKLRFL